MTIAGATAVLARETTARDVRVETVFSYQEFLDMEPAWNELVDSAGVDHPFLEHMWLRTWWECFGAGSELHILVVKEDHEIIAIAPLILTRVRMLGMTVRRLGFFYNAHVPRADFIISRQSARRSEDAYRAIWNHLLSAGGSWDLLQLCQLPGGSRTLDEIKGLASEGGSPTGVWLPGESPFVALDTSWDQYYANLAAKHRSNLRNRLKRLGQTGPVSVETVIQEEALPDALGEGFRLEELAWKGEAGTAISCDANLRKFYETFARRAAAKNWLRLSFLQTGGQRIAFDYSLAYRDQIFLLKHGYDPEFSAYSPSNLLVSMILETAFEKGVAKYDFLGENAPWKTSWTKTSKPNYWLFVFSRSLKGRCLHSLKFRIVPWIKGALARRKKEAPV
jgi:CelD/BcsL family acetyltransferase involved in cellulose biosynthesis